MNQAVSGFGTIRLYAVAGLLLALPLTSAGQVYRCADASGGIVFSDSPCGASAEVHDLPSHKTPSGTPAAPPPPQPSLRDQRREREAQQARERATDAEERIREMREENHDQERCARIQRRIARHERADPLGASFSPDVAELRQKASLYCGPDQPTTPPLPGPVYGR